jgi:quercetin dioxygenase-like cupin family protein
MNSDHNTTPWPGVTVSWLADDRDGATHGCGVQLKVAPGASYEPQRYDDVETVLYVCRGAGRHTGSEGPIELGEDDTLTVLSGGWHGFENTGDEDALVVLSYTGTTSLPWDRAQTGAAGNVADGKAFSRPMHAVSDDPAAVSGRGFHQMRVSFAAAEGAQATTAGSGRWPGGRGQHMWHRHHHADELIYIYEGEAQHMTEDGTELLPAGGLAWVSANVWHSMRSDEDGSDLDAIFLYLGAPSLEASGYEPRHDAATPESR